MTHAERQQLKEVINGELRARGLHKPTLACSGCGGELDGFSDGCDTCRCRRKNRASRVLSGGHDLGLTAKSGRVPPRARMLSGGDDVAAAADSGSPVASPPESIRLVEKRVVTFDSHCAYCGHRCFGYACQYDRDLVQLEAEGN